MAPSRTRRRVVHVCLWLAIVGVLGGNVFVLSQRNKTTAVTAADALAAFRAEPVVPGPVPVDAGTTVPPVTVAPAGPTTTPVGPPGATATTSAPAVRTAAAAPRPAAPASSTATTPAAVPAMGRPAEGVYAYRTTGGDRVSVAGASHDYPDETYATVRHLDGCKWFVRNDVVEEHVDERTMCSGVDTVTQLSQARWVTFFGKRDGMELACDPPIVVGVSRGLPMPVSESVCSGGGTDARMRRTLVGRERVDVGGTVVDALRIVLDGEFSGKATGRSRDELWVAEADGMTLRWDRMVDTMADAAFGAEVRYQEQASFVLTSLTPRT